MTDHSIERMIPTDVATILLFHPDDLTDTQDWPLGWYAEGPQWRWASREGRMVAWGTRSDGGFKVRLTRGDLTAPEIEYSGPRWVFPYTSRLGRVYLDNSDGLLGESRMTDPADQPDYWYDLPMGDYDVTVTAIEWDAQPGATDAEADTLPNYVVQFAPRAGAVPAVATTPPNLECQRDAEASVYTPQIVERPRYALGYKDEPIDFDQVLSASASSDVMVTFGTFTSVGEADLLEVVGDVDRRAFAAFKKPVVMAPDVSIGALGQVCRLSGSGGAPGSAPRFSLQSLGPVRITAIEGRYVAGQVVGLTGGLFRKGPPPVEPPFTAPLMAVRVEPVDVGDFADGSIDLEAYRAAVLASLDGAEGPGVLGASLGGAASYHRHSVADYTSVRAINTFLLRHLPMPAETRLELEIHSVGDAAKILMSRLGAV